MHWTRKSALVSDTDQAQRSSLDHSGQLGRRTHRSFGAHKNQLIFPRRNTKAQVGQGRQEYLSHCVVAAAGMSAVYKSRRPKSSAARRRRDDVAWPISQHAMLPACRLAAGKTWTAAAAALAQSVVAARLSSCAPLCETPSSSQQTAIYDFFSHLPVLSAVCAFVANIYIFALRFLP